MEIQLTLSMFVDINQVVLVPIVVFVVIVIAGGGFGGGVGGCDVDIKTVL